MAVQISKLARSRIQKIDQFLTSATITLFLGYLTGAIQIAGVPSMVTAHLLVFLAWVIGVLKILLTPPQREISQSKILKILSLAVALFLFDRWMVWMQPVPRPFVLDYSFLTIVPFNTGPGSPIPDFLNDTGSNTLRNDSDPLRRYPRLSTLASDTVIEGAKYDNIQQLQRLWDANRPVSNEERHKLLAEVLQYYIIERLDDYQSDHSAAIAILGGGKGVSHKTGNHPPDMTRTTPEEFLTTIEANRPSRFAFIEMFRGLKRGYWVPQSTKISLENTTSTSNELNYVFKLHNPNVYLLTVAITEFPFGADSGLPKNYRTTSDINPELVLSYSFIIKCHFEYYRRTDTHSLEQEQYTKWAESLFASLKTSFANE